jgi:O-antigen/teichoic acid export membrane protein
VTAQQASIAPLRTEHLRADLTRRSVRGGVLTITSQAFQFLFSTISTIVLARLLLPADFGLVAMVTAVTGLAQGFADLGLSEATIQRDDITQEQVNTLFWINVSIGLALTLVAAAIGPFLAWFYKEPQLSLITVVVSPTFLIGGLRVQHDALLRRQMRFTALTTRDMISTAAGVLIAVIMAWKGAGYWAIVAQPLVTNFSQMSLSWLMVGWIPGAPRRGANVRPLIAFGGKVAASYVLLSLLRGADLVLLGRYWGAGPVGLYSRAYNLLMLPARQLHAPVSAVAVPAFSRIRGDPERFARYYLRTINLMVWITAPIFGFLFVAAEPVIVMVLGSRWQEAAPVFKVLVISALGQVVHGSSIWLFVSRGESGRLLKLTSFISPILIGSYLIGLPFGIKGVALSGSVVMITILPWVLKYTFRGTELTLARLGRAILCPTVSSLAGVMLANMGLSLLSPQERLPELFVIALGFATAYLLAGLIPSVREEVLSLKRLFRELRSGGQRS